jgi:hypothetical protein
MSNEKFYRQKFSEYQKAKESWDEKFEKTNTDIFVANYVCYTNPQKQIMSTCTWTQGVPSYLPETDYISFVDLDTGEAMHMVPFSILKDNQTMFNIKDVPQSNPAYYEGTNFPSLNQIEQFIQNLKK